MADNKKDDDKFLEAVSIATKVAAEALVAGQKSAAPAVKPFCVPTGAQCSDCGQPAFVTEKGLMYACNSKHVKMMVMPNETAHFPGLCLNGVWYKSTQGQPITVPANNDFQSYLNEWDRQEREYQTGRKITPSQYNPISRPPKASNVA